MQYFWDNEEICHGLSLFETLHFVLYSWSSYLALFLGHLNIYKIYNKITQIQNDP